MAQAALQTPPAASSPPPPATAETKASVTKQYEEARERLLRALGGYNRGSTNEQNGVLEEHYHIFPDRPLPHLNTTLAMAYEAQDERDPTRALFALLCPYDMPARIKLIKALKGKPIPNMVAMHAAGPVELKGARRFAIVYERPKGRSLTEIVKDRGKPFPESVISAHVIGPLSGAIHALAQLGFSHGRVNPDNIFFGETITLGECAAEPCGYSQPYQFEPPERVQCLAAGKGESVPENDHFALGVLAAWLRFGQRIFSRSLTPEAHIMRLLAEGAYVGFTKNIEQSDVMMDILRGTLNDRPEERWKWEQIHRWAKGRRYNMLPPNQPNLATRALMLEEEGFDNLRTVSQGIYTYWEKAAEAIRDNTLTRWLDLSIRRKDVSDMVRRAINSLGGSNAQNLQQDQELIARVITMLDPSAPLSLKTARTHVLGIGTSLAEGFRSQDNVLVQHLIQMIEFGLPVVWSDVYKRRDIPIPPDVSDQLWLVDRMRLVLRMPGWCFGTERMLYELNPDLPCQSPLLEGQTVVTLRDMLQVLDKIAPEKVRTQAPLDRHIACFVGARLSLSKEPSVPAFSGLPSLAHHPALLTLKMMDQASDNAGKPKLPGLCAWIAMELLDVVKELHSTSLREELFEQLQQAASTGSLHTMLLVMNQKQFTAADINGYRDAIQTYIRSGEEISELRSRVANKRKASITGYGIAKYIAHVGLLVILLAVLKSYVFP